MLQEHLNIDINIITNSMLREFCHRPQEINFTININININIDKKNDINNMLQKYLNIDINVIFNSMLQEPLETPHSLHQFRLV